MPLPTLTDRRMGRFSVTKLDQVLHPFPYRITGGRWIVGRPAVLGQAASTYPGHRLDRAEATHRVPIVVLEPGAMP